MKFTKIFLDGADIENVEKLSNESYISGFTSNPSLMTKSGITNYHDFILRFLSASNNKPVSFEVVAENKTIVLKTEYIAPWNFDGEPQLLTALVVMISGFLFLYFLERNSNKKNAV